MSVALLLLTGCKNGNETAYDEVGEVRVFDAPRREVATRSALQSSLHIESAPAPRPMGKALTLLKASPRTASRSHASVGEMELD